MPGPKDLLLLLLSGLTALALLTGRFGSLPRTVRSVFRLPPGERADRWIRPAPDRAKEGSAGRGQGAESAGTGPGASSNDGRSAVGFVRQMFKEFSNDNGPTLAASIAYFAAFALPSLLVLLVFVLGRVVGPEHVKSVIGGRTRDILGQQGAQMIQSMIRNANKIGSAGSTLGLILGGAALLFSASGAFAALQRALNLVWEVTPDPEQGGARPFAMKRLLSLAMIAGIGILVLASLVINSLLGAIGGMISQILPPGLTGHLLRAANELVTLGMLTVVIAATFKVLPDAEVSWRHVWVGALFTAGLLAAAIFGMSQYVARASPGSAFGAASAFAVILLGIFVSALIVLLGAEFTQVWIRRKGYRVEPSSHAVRIKSVIVRGEAGEGSGSSERGTSGDPLPSWNRRGRQGDTHRVVNPGPREHS